MPEKCPFKVGEPILDKKYKKIIIFTANMAKTPELYDNERYGFKRFVKATSCGNPNDVEPRADVAEIKVKEKVKQEIIPTQAQNEAQKLLPAPTVPATAVIAAAEAGKNDAKITEDDKKVEEDEE